MLVHVVIPSQTNEQKLNVSLNSQELSTWHLPSAEGPGRVIICPESIVPSGKYNVSTVSLATED